MYHNIEAVNINGRLQQMLLFRRFNADSKISAEHKYYRCDLLPMDHIT